MNSWRNVTLCLSQVSITGLQGVRKFNFIYVRFAFVLLWYLPPETVLCCVALDGWQDLSEPYLAFPSEKEDNVTSTLWDGGVNTELDFHSSCLESLYLKS